MRALLVTSLTTVVVSIAAFALSAANVVVVVDGATGPAAAPGKQRIRRPRRKRKVSQQLRKEAELTFRLITPTLWAKAPDGFACNLDNIGTETRYGKVRIISDGVVLLDTGAVSVEPGYTNNQHLEGLENGGPIYCEFSIEKSAQQDFTGAAKVYHAAPNSTTTDFVAVTAT